MILFLLDELNVSKQTMYFYERAVVFFSTFLFKLIHNKYDSKQNLLRQKSELSGDFYLFIDDDKTTSFYSEGNTSQSSRFRRIQLCSWKQGSFYSQNRLKNARIYVTFQQVEISSAKSLANIFHFRFYFDLLLSRLQGETSSLRLSNWMLPVQIRSKENLPF